MYCIEIAGEDVIDSIDKVEEVYRLYRALLEVRSGVVGRHYTIWVNRESTVDSVFASVYNGNWLVRRCVGGATFYWFEAWSNNRRNILVVVERGDEMVAKLMVFRGSKVRVYESRRRGDERLQLSPVATAVIDEVIDALYRKFLRAQFYFMRRVY